MCRVSVLPFWRRFDPTAPFTLDSLALNLSPCPDEGLPLNIHIKGQLYRTACNGYADVEATLNRF